MTAPNTVEKKTTKERKEILCTKHIFLNYIIKTTHFISAQFSSVTHSCPTLCDPMNRSTPGLLVPHQFPESTQTHVHRVGDAIQPFHPVMPFSSCPQSFPASGSFQMSQLFASGGPSIGVSASTSVLSKNTQDWSPLGWTGWISLQSKGLSRVLSNTTVQKHQFFGAQLSSQYKSQLFKNTGKFPKSDRIQKIAYS